MGSKNKKRSAARKRDKGRSGENEAGGVRTTSGVGSVAEVSKAPSPGSLEQPPGSPLRRLVASERFWLVVILAVAFSLRIGNLLEMRANSPFFDMPTTDSQIYDNLAQTLAEGEWLGTEVFNYNPLYPYFLGLLYSLFGHSYLMVKLVQTILGVASCLLVYLIGQRLFNRRVGLVAAAMAACFGPFIFYEELLLATALTGFLLVSTVLLLLRAGERPTVIRCILAGLLLGVSFVSRPTLLPVIAFGWLLFTLRKERKRRIASRLAILTLFASLMVLPVTIRNYVVGDDLVLISAHTGHTFFLGNHAESTGYFNIPSEIPRTLVDDPIGQKEWFSSAAEEDIGRPLKPSEVSQYWSHRTVQWITAHPTDWLALMGKKVIRLLNDYEASDNQNYYFSSSFSRVLRLPLLEIGGVLPLALLGMFMARRSFRKLSLVYLFIAAYTVGVLLFFVNSRYRLPMVPFLMIFAAHAAVQLTEEIRRRRIAPLLKHAALLGVLVYIAFLDVGQKKEASFIDYFNMGNKFFNKDRTADAIEAYEHSIAMKTNYLSSHNNLAIVYAQDGQFERALREWRVVLELAEAKKSSIHSERARANIERLNRKIGTSKGRTPQRPARK